MGNIFDTELKFLPTVGEKRFQLMRNELKITTYGDLLRLYPYRYLDRTKIYNIRDITEETTSLIQVKARVYNVEVIGSGRAARLEVMAQDTTGRVKLIWFSGVEWALKKIEIGREYIIFGKPNFFNGFVSFAHPETDIPMSAEALAKMSVYGIYPSTEKINKIGGTKFISSLIRVLWKIVEPHIKESLPDYLINQQGLISLKDSLFNIHFPKNDTLLHKAEQRLKFEEFLTIQLSLLRQKEVRIKKNDGALFPSLGDKFNDFYNNHLPFALTSAQKRVLKEIRRDTMSGRQMNRLLQGDVGSGKTIVAFISMLFAIDNNYQAAIMAPTEILANQHFVFIDEICQKIGLKAALLTGSTRKKERQRIAEMLESGELNILIGTHALIEDSVQFSNLGLIIIDEQHRFGVKQRSKLWAKNVVPPHVLVMTATPIPRTLAMTLYGDLDVSVIDELPPGRKPIKTLHFNDSRRLQVFGFMKEQIRMGRQIYIVYPLVNESEKLDYKSLEDGYVGITRAFPFPDYVTVIVHGQLKSKDKEFGMGQFIRGEANIMVATTVIEVGVNVPNASVMIIESAERFGLSQLHQLRGRVGRGADQSFCILMSGEKLSTASRKRLKAMTESNDGFELSELDLELRGYGDLEGTQQSGNMFDLKIASVSKDTALLQTARAVSEAILDDDPELLKEVNKPLRDLIFNYKMGVQFDFSQIS